MITAALGGTCAVTHGRTIGSTTAALTIQLAPFDDARTDVPLWVMSAGIEIAYDCVPRTIAP